MGTSKHSKLKENPSKLQEKTLKTQGKPLKTQGTQFFGIFRILLCEKDVPKKTLDAFIHFHTLFILFRGLYVLSYDFKCFHTLLYAFIRFYILFNIFINTLYMIVYAFIRFHIPYIRFLYDFIRIQMLPYAFP